MIFKVGLVMLNKINQEPLLQEPEGIVTLINNIFDPVVCTLTENSENRNFIVVQDR